MNVTSALFEAFLKCPTKCYLRSTGQAGGENVYAEWVRAQNDVYRSKTAKLVIEAAADTEGPVASPAAKDLKTAAWRLAVDLHVKAGAIESRIHAVERQPPQGQRRPAQFIPIRLTFFNKLTKGVDHRLHGPLRQALDFAVNHLHWPVDDPGSEPLAEYQVKR